MLWQSFSKNSAVAICSIILGVFLRRSSQYLIPRELENFTHTSVYALDCARKNQYIVLKETSNLTCCILCDFRGRSVSSLIKAIYDFDCKGNNPILKGLRLEEMDQPLSES